MVVACATVQNNLNSEVKIVHDRLTGNNGMTLYVFDKDSYNKSNCNGKCAENWPPLLVHDQVIQNDYSIVIRDDGKSQLAFKGKPLYFWNKDEKPGDVKGDGFNNLWHIAKP